LSGFGLTPEARFLSYCANSSQFSVNRVLSPEFKAELAGKTFMADDLARMAQTPLSGMVRFQERDLDVYLPNHNLHYTDRMSMAAGVEARVPLLDLELVDRVLKYPYSWRLKGGKTKAILRAAARGIVPDEIIDRPKAGLGAPYRKWLRYDLAELWNDLTSESEVKKRGWFDHSALQQARRDSQEGRQDLYMLQWAALTMELWARQYLDS
jgi:asparagine synthase (glutamine-hydrolysing)